MGSDAVVYAWVSMGVPDHSWNSLGVGSDLDRSSRVQKTCRCFLGFALGLAKIFVTLHSGQEPDGISILWDVIVPCMKIFLIFLDTY